MVQWFLLLILFVLAIWLKNKLFTTITIYDYQKGLKYSRGKFIRILGTGYYWCFRPFTAVHIIDIRPKLVSVPGQEVLSSDGVTLKVSVSAQYDMVDIEKAVKNIANPYEEALHLILQLALRKVVSAYKIDDLLAKRNELSGEIVAKAIGRAEEIGLKLVSAEIKDIMFPGELKKIFSQVAKAKQEGLAMLEKARGETAALRNLANSANMVKNNPALMQLRLLHTTGNTLVVGMPSNYTAVPLGKNDDSSEPIEGNPE